VCNDFWGNKEPSPNHHGKQGDAGLLVSFGGKTASKKSKKQSHLTLLEGTKIKEGQVVLLREKGSIPNKKRQSSSLIDGGGTASMGGREYVIRQKDRVGKGRGEFRPGGQGQTGEENQPLRKPGLGKGRGTQARKEGSMREGGAWGDVVVRHTDPSRKGK